MQTWGPFLQALRESFLVKPDFGAKFDVTSITHHYGLDCSFSREPIFRGIWRAASPGILELSGCALVSSMNEFAVGREGLSYQKR